MLTAKKCLFVFMFCFLTASFSFHYLWAEEGSSPSNLQKAEEKQATAQKQPQITIAQPQFDMGEVYEGNTIVHAFAIKNTGTAELNINKVKAGWGCTVAEYDKAISPGQEGKVTLKVNTTNKKGQLNQSATIFSNDPKTPSTKITVSAVVKHFISIQPSTRLRLQGFHGENVSKKVTITSHEEKPFKITDISSTIDSSIEYKLETIEKEKAYSLEIKTRSGIKESFRGKVVLKTSSQKKPKIQLQVMGKVKKELKVVPQYLFFGVIDTNKKAIDPQSLTRTVTVNRQRDGELTIGKIKTHSAWISAEVETNKKDKEHTIVIKLDKEKLQKGKFRERVTINTMFSGRSEAATIVVEGKVI